MSWFKLEPTHLFFLDNSLGLGHREGVLPDLVADSRTVFPEKINTTYLDTVEFRRYYAAMSRKRDETWSLAELAEETGLTPRTIRYYISRGLLGGPSVAGRGAVYTAGHLDRLRQIQDLQSRGAMLAQIGRLLGAEGHEAAAPAAEPWYRYQLDEDVAVLVRGDVSPWRNREIREALGAFAANIRRQRKDDNASHE